MKLLVLLALASCTAATSYPSDSPDARLVERDASGDAPQPDAAPPHTEGCNMGLLPAARTITIVDGDPIPGSIINELQDNVIGSKRKPFTRRFFPKFTIQGGWAAGALVPDSAAIAFPGYTSTGAAAIGHIEIPHEVGDRLIGLSWQACGNGTTDVVFDVVYATDYAIVGPVSFPGTLTDTNRGTRWGTATMVIGGPQIVVDGSVLELQVQANAAGYTISQFSATFDRL